MRVGLYAGMRKTTLSVVFQKQIKIETIGEKIGNGNIKRNIKSSYEITSMCNESICRNEENYTARDFPYLLYSQKK